MGLIGSPLSGGSDNSWLYPLSALSIEPPSSRYFWTTGCLVTTHHIKSAPRGIPMSRHHVAHTVAKHMFEHFVALLEPLTKCMQHNHHGHTRPGPSPRHQQNSMGTHAMKTHCSKHELKPKHQQHARMHRHEDTVGNTDQCNKSIW